MRVLLTTCCLLVTIGLFSVTPAESLLFASNSPLADNSPGTQSAEKNSNMQDSLDTAMMQIRNLRDSIRTLQASSAGATPDGRDAGYNQMVEQRYFSYLQTLTKPREQKGLFGLFGRSDQELMEFQITELQNYLETFSPGARTDQVLGMLGDVYRNSGKDALALAVYLKQLILYPTSEIFQQIQSKVFTLVSDKSSLQPMRDPVTELLNRGLQDETYQENYYSYLELLTSILSTELIDWYLQECQRFLSSYPNADKGDQIYLWMAGAHQTREQYEKAALTYTKLQLLRPDSEFLPLSYLRKGEIYRDHLKDYDKAVDAFQMLTREAEDDSMAIMAHLTVGDLYANQLKEYEKAINAYQQVVSRYGYDSKAIDAYFAQAQLYRNRLNQPYKAVEHYMSVVEKYPEQSEKCASALRNAGDIYRAEIKDYFSAVETYSRLANRYPQHPSVPDRLLIAGDLAANRLNNNQRAMELYQSIIENYPETREAKTAERELVKLRESGQN